MGPADDLGFRALVTGAIAGALLKSRFLNIEIDIPTDGEGAYEPRVIVIGRESGTRLEIDVRIVPNEHDARLLRLVE